MTTTMENPKDQPSSGTLCSGCRRRSRMLLVLSLISFVLLQGMTFFVALNGGYETTRALIFMLVPLFGPLFCAFQMIFAGTGAPLALLFIFLAGTLTLWTSVYVREHCNCDMMDAPVFTAADFSLTPVETVEQNRTAPASTTFTPISQPVAISKPEPAVSPETETVTLDPTAQQAANIANCQPSSASPTPAQPIDTLRSIPVSGEPLSPVKTVKQTGNEEYDRTLQDVLSILNK